MQPEQRMVHEFFLTHPEDAARRVENMTFSDAARLLAEFEAEPAARVIAHMIPQASVSCLPAMPLLRSAAVLAKLPVEFSARLLRRMEENTRTAMLGAMPRGTADDIAVLLQYPEGTAGAVMDPQIPSMPEESTAGEAMTRIRNDPRRIYYYLFVVDRQQHLVGALDLRELMLADPGDSLRSIMIRNPVALQANSELAEVMAHPSWNDLDALPVVDRNGALLGMVRQRTLRSLEITQAFRTDGSGPSILLSLGELYWYGMRELTDLLMSPPTEDAAPETEAMEGGPAL